MYSQVYLCIALANRSNITFFVLYTARRDDGFSVEFDCSSDGEETTPPAFYGDSHSKDSHNTKVLLSTKASLASSMLRERQELLKK